jgi:hypothetical protein
MNSNGGVLQNINKYFNTIIPYDTQKKLGDFSGFLSSNTMIARGTFLLGVLILFSILFYIGSRVVYYFLSPSETPYLINGMKDATEPLTIVQNTGHKNSIPILRSNDQYGGVEFSYSFWIYVNDVNYNETKEFKHVFNKGSPANTHRESSGETGIFGPNNAPGVYLYNGKGNTAALDNLLPNFPILGMLVTLNVFHNNESKNVVKTYYDDIYVDGIPIKKWVNVIIRVTSQNICDIYINGNLTKRHKLSNIVKQNYDNLYVNYNGGFSGNLSDLKYYNYAIGTLEIDALNAKGPNLKVMKNSNMEKASKSAKGQYLATQWYFNDTDVIT